jgi:trans-2,3-dihydro-3-hydroxyanthranilate isomerase
MLQEPAVFGPELDPAEVLATVGLTAADAHPELPCRPVSTGVWCVMAPLRDAAALARIAVDQAALAALLGAQDAIVVYVAAPDLHTGAVRARSFTGSVVGEDPATGGAVGPFCALVAAGGGPTRLEVTQGVEMGRPSRLRAAVEGDRIRVGGDVVVVVDGRVTLPG